MKIKYLLSDLDGVIRKYPQSRDQAIEKKFGLIEGAIFSAAFKGPHLEDAVCGRISDEHWREEIKKALAKLYAEEQVNAALNEWSDFSGILDHEYLQFLENNFSNTPIAILTNGTTRLKTDLAKLGLDSPTYRIFNSAEIGTCKPKKEIYLYVLESLKVKPSEILFIDDSLSHIKAAEVLGFQTHHYTTLEAFAAQLQQTIT